MRFGYLNIIFLQFEGTVNGSNSLFNYTDGKTYADYTHPDFVPIFIDEFPTDEVDKAKEICGGQHASTACIFDFLLTKDEAVGKSSGKVEEDAEETLKASGIYFKVLWYQRYLFFF